MIEAVFNKRDVCVVGRRTMDDIMALAEASPRKRARLCMHRGQQDHVHEMVIALVGGSYVQPHRHPQPKAESYHVVRGEMDVFFFDDAGALARYVEMGDPASGKPFLYRLSSSLWHMPLARSKSVIYHEVYEGPFVKDVDVAYASWAPPESDAAAVAKFVAKAYVDAPKLGDMIESPSGAALRYLGGDDR
ncbi:MAG: WbuC family cupin fold metalloprotein [Elusimicrobia bacterium]|nr:WbuC family cupin fold metalloprotein [Elusimicrobiota bacterium]